MSFKCFNFEILQSAVNKRQDFL